MNRTVFTLPAKSEYLTSSGLAVVRTAEQFTGGANRLDDLINLLDRRPGVVLSSGTTVPGRYESFDLGFADPPLVLETTGTKFSLRALNGRGEVLIAFLGDVLREPCVVISEKSARELSGHIIRGEAPVEEEIAQRGVVHRDDPRTPVLADVDIAFTGKAAEYVPHRRPRQPVPLAQAGLIQIGVRVQLHRQNLALQIFVEIALECLRHRRSPASCCSTPTKMTRLLG